MSEETFRWVITGAVIIATLCILVMAGVAVLLQRIVAKVQGKVDDLMGRVTPIIDTASRIAAENAPKVNDIASSAQVIAANARDVSGELKDQAHRFAEVGKDIADRTRSQVARADAAIDDSVEQMHVAGAQAKEAMMKPVREANAVAAGIRAAVSTYAAGRRTPIDHIPQDEEMFI
jgi:methyl-accepting chemotaxis protein